MDKPHFAPGHDQSDRDLHDEPDMPSQSGGSTGGLGADIATRDEERNALGNDPGLTRVTKNDKVQPRIPTRADHDGGRG